MYLSHTCTLFTKRLNTICVKSDNGGEKGIRTLGGVKAPHRRSRSAP